MVKAPNEEQLKVVNDLDNNLILFASAGTGKTFTVAKRVSNILRSNRAKAEEILCLTFTIKACNEMKEDVYGYVGEKGRNVEIRTIHGFCYQLTKEEDRRGGARFSDATVCDDGDEEELLRSILSSQYALWECGDGQAEKLRKVAGIKLEQEDGETNVLFPIYEKRNALMNFVSTVKHCREEQKFYSGNDCADYQKTLAYLQEKQPKKYEDCISYYARYSGKTQDLAFEKAMQKHVGTLLKTYNDYLRQSNQMDYDDLMIYASRYLDKREIRARWENRYKYIIVDEMQDTSVLEYSVLKRVFGKNNVMMCGDFFQSIYEWRGSKPELVLSDFISSYQAKTYMFSENYRSTQLLAEAGFGYLRNTYPDFVGKYCPADMHIHSEDMGGKIHCIGFDNRREEAYQIFNYIKKFPKEDLQNLCVMARTNKYIAALCEEFEKCNEKLPEEERVRFFSVEENCQFYKKAVVKDVLAVLKLLFNATDRVSMERIAQKYVKQVGMKTIENLRLCNPYGVSISSFADGNLYAHGDTYQPLLDAFQAGNIVVYDTETTGLDLETDQIVQISAIRMDTNGNILATLDQMIEPTIPIGKGAYETHGFDLEYIRSHGGVSAKEGLERFSAFVRGSVLVGHNSFRFDAPLIKRQLLENNLPQLETLGEYDTLVIAKQFHSELPDFKLSTLCGKYGIVNEAAHNALGDITATGKVLLRMIKENVLPTALERRAICAKLAPKFEKFYRFLSELRVKIAQNDGKDLLKQIIEKMMMRKKYTAISDVKALDDLSECLDGTEMKNAEAFFRKYLSDAALSGSQMDALVSTLRRIPVITVHQSKGCEFDTVILAGADGNHFPSFSSRESGTEEEEKKVFYVAITRAKKKLIMTKTAYNGRFSVAPSPYVAKIPQEFVSYSGRWFE